MRRRRRPPGPAGPPPTTSRSHVSVRRAAVPGVTSPTAASRSRVLERRSTSPPGTSTTGNWPEETCISRTITSASAEVPSSSQVEGSRLRARASSRYLVWGSERDPTRVSPAPRWVSRE
jgi:hypothetical protein